MLNFHKNKLINKVLDNFYDTFSHTLNTMDYVPEKYNKKISAYIFKNMKKAFRQIDKEDKIYQKKLKLRAKEKLEQQQEQSDIEVKPNIFQKISNLFMAKKILKTMENQSNEENKDNSNN